MRQVLRSTVVFSAALIGLCHLTADAAQAASTITSIKDSGGNETTTLRAGSAVSLRVCLIRGIKLHCGSGIQVQLPKVRGGGASTGSSPV